MGDATDVIQTIQHLTDAHLRRATDLCGSEVASSETRLETYFNNSTLNHLVDIADVQDIFKVSRCAPRATMDFTTQTGADILDHLRSEEGAEEIC